MTVKRTVFNVLREVVSSDFDSMCSFSLSVL